MGAQKAADNMLNYTKSATPTSLTTITDKPLVREAKAISKGVRQYMGEKKAPQGMEAAAQRMLEVAEASKLQDEAYVQIMKQLTANENADSRAKGWDLMALTCSTFMPSEALENFVVMFLRKNAPDGHKPYTALLHETQYSKKGGVPGAAMIPNMLQKFKEGEGRSRYSISEGESTGPTVN